MPSDENGIQDQTLRSKIASWEIDQLAYNLTIKRYQQNAEAGQSLGAFSSFLKYYASELNKDKMELTLEFNGHYGLAWEKETKDGNLAQYFCRTKGNSIEGGTSEIQLNILASAVLGLPRS